MFKTIPIDPYMNIYEGLRFYNGMYTNMMETHPLMIKRVIEEGSRYLVGIVGIHMYDNEWSHRDLSTIGRIEDTSND